MGSHNKQDAVFDLIKTMSKAEKRNFKLYATRLDGNQEAKFMSLFDCLDSAEEYDENSVLLRCPVGKEQLPNVKAHLYRQILVSLRLLSVRRSEEMRIKEHLDYAHILYERGLYEQCGRILEKAGKDARETEAHHVLLEIVRLQNKIETLNVARDMTSSSDAACREISAICSQVETAWDLENIAVRAYSLYQKLGYARTQKDLDLLLQYFQPRIEGYAGKCKSFREKFYFYQACAWYHYIRHDFIMCYRYGRLWVDLFDSHPKMKGILYEEYLKGWTHILEGLYLMKKYRHFAENLRRFEREAAAISGLNTNAFILANRILFTHKIHKCFTEGEFGMGIECVADLDDFICRYSQHLDVHFKMLMYYKVACLYFGAGDYPRCMDYLASVISTKDPQIRRDLQCFARILNLIASYELGIDYNLDYQIRSVYKFLVKMNDMHAVQNEMLSFLKRLNTIYASDLNRELKELYYRLKPYEDHPYERRTFYYLDIISWLESKISGKTVGEIVKRKFIELSGVAKA